MVTRQIEGNVVRIDYVAIQKYEVDDIDPDVEPGIFVRINNDILQAHFVIILLFCVFKATLKVVTTLVDVFKAVHVSLLLGFILVVQRRHEEIHLVLHLLNVTAETAPVLKRLLPLHRS